MRQEAFKGCSRTVQVRCPGLFKNGPYHLLRDRSRRANDSGLAGTLTEDCAKEAINGNTNKHNADEHRD
jgi:hypothetical protein